MRSARTGTALAFLHPQTLKAFQLVNIVSVSRSHADSQKAHTGALAGKWCLSTWLPSSLATQRLLKVGALRDVQ